MKEAKEGRTRTTVRGGGRSRAHWGTGQTAASDCMYGLQQWSLGSR